MTAPVRPATPFLLVSGTRSAFLLLISVVFAIPTVWRPALFGLPFGARSTANDAEYRRCSEAVFAVPGEIRDPSEQLSQQCAAIMKNAAPDLRPAMLLTFATLCLLTAVQYWFGPAWRIRRRRLRPIDPAAFPALCGELDALANWTLAGGRVRFLLDIVNPAVDGLAFGRVGRRYIVLSRGLMAEFDRDRSRFRAVVLHELAHVRNRDLDITAVTLALWRSFLIVILVPGFLGSLLGIAVGTAPLMHASELPFVSGPVLSWVFAGQLAGLAGLVWLTRYSVLQARELHADARVLTWQPDPTPLRGLFDASPKPRWSLAELRRRTHPHLGVRANALTDTNILLRQGFAFSFALGACFSLSMDAAASFTARLRTDPFYWPAEGFVLVLTVALGIRALRAAAYADSSGIVTDRLRARLGLAIGLPVGWSLAPSRMSDHTMVPFSVQLQLTSLLVLAAAGWLLGLWVEWVMAQWEPRVRASARPSWAAVPPIALIVLVLVLSARAVFEVQLWVITARVINEPPVSDPLELVFLVAQRLLDLHFISGWLPVTLALLLIIPMVTGRRPAATLPARPRPHALAVVVIAALALALSIVGWTAVDRGLGLGFAAPDPLATPAGIGAGVAAVAVLVARTTPVAKGALAGLVGAVVFGLLFHTRMFASWPLVTWIFGRALEAAVVSGVLISALRHVRWPGLVPRPPKVGI